MTILLVCILIVMINIFAFNPILNKIIQAKEVSNATMYHRYITIDDKDLMMQSIIQFLLVIINEQIIHIDLLFFLVVMLFFSFLVRLDQVIRIIPNEAILLILLVKIFNLVIENDMESIGGCLFSMIVASGLVLLSGILSRFITGEFGVGSGDVKLIGSLAFTLNFVNATVFLLGITLCLALFLGWGYLFKKINLKTTFPMCFFIVGGYAYVSIHVQVMECFKFLLG